MTELTPKDLHKAQIRSQWERGWRTGLGSVFAESEPGSLGVGLITGK